MQRIKIKVNTEPVAKGRARIVFTNGKVHSYTPERTKIAQDILSKRFKKHQHKAFNKRVPVKVTLMFYRVKSKWLPKSEDLPCRRPDLDNFIKLVLDTANGVLFYDDAQITSIIAKKRWAINGKGYIIIKLEEDKNG